MPHGIKLTYGEEWQRCHLDQLIQSVVLGYP